MDITALAWTVGAMLGSYMQRPCDYLDDYGHLDLSRWQDRFDDCHALGDGDRIMNCVNLRQPFVKMRTPPKMYPGGALPPDEYVTTTTSRSFIGGQTTHSFVTHVLHGIWQSDAPSLPTSFDIRERWPECKGIVNTVLEQKCNNCWAYSSSGVMSDRTCIASGGRVKARLSPDDLTTCCTTCEAVPNNCANYGGYPSKAFDYWISNGVVGSMCKPSRSYANPSSTQCHQRCKNGRNYTDVLHFGQSSWSMNNAESIQQEIYVNGSVAVLLELHTDLYGYEGGVYIPTTNTTNGYHSVRLIGWGELNAANVTVPYWIAVNSWGYDWGENGTFRVIRGVNAMNIETWASTGAPLIGDELLRRYA